MIKFLMTASREANVLVVVAITALLLKILFLNRYPAQFLGAYELGIIVEAVLASVVASYVFYLLVVHAKEFSDREFLRPYVETHSKILIRACITQTTEIGKASAVDLNFHTMTESDVLAALSKIPPYSDAPLIMSVQTLKHANWFQYFNYHKLKSNESTRKLLVQLPFLEAQIVSDLTAIDDCTHFSVLDLLASFGAANKDLSALSQSFFEYCQLCKQLESNLTRIGFSTVQ